MSLTRLLVPIGLLAVLPALLSAETGLVRAYAVVGDVSLVDESTGVTVPLRPGRTFSQGFTIRSGAGGKASFYLSNGSSVLLDSGSTLTVSTFEQAPFSAEAGQFHTLVADPSPSRTHLALTGGRMSGKVRQLAPTSTFDVDTPLGRVSVVGTTFDISLQAGAGGQLELVVTNVDGGVRVIPLNGTMETVPTGTVVSVRTEAGGGTTVIYDRRALDEATAQAIYAALAAAGALGEGISNAPVFLPVSVDPSVVSPEGGE